MNNIPYICGVHLHHLHRQEVFHRNVRARACVQ